MQPYATTEFLLKDPIGYFCACMLFYYKKTQTMISSPFEAIFNEYSNPAFLANMQQVCSCNGFIGIFGEIIAKICILLNRCLINVTMKMVVVFQEKCHQALFFSV